MACAVLPFLATCFVVGRDFWNDTFEEMFGLQQHKRVKG